MASALEEPAVAMRVLNAGSFHTGFELMIVPNYERAELCIMIAFKSDRLLVRNLLAGALYRDRQVLRVTG